MNTFFFQ